MNKYCFDTNALLLHPHLLDLDGEKIIPYIVLHELDKLKIGYNETACRAREAVKKLRNRSDIKYDSRFDKNNSFVIMGNNDDCIIECAAENNATIVTGDYLVELKAKAKGIEVYEIDDDTDDYSGYKEVILEDDELAKFYEDLTVNSYDLLTNQYIIIKNKQGKVIEIARWDGQQFQYVRQKGFKTNLFGKFSPYDEYQMCALDSLHNNQLTMIKGKAGSGKSLLALNFAWEQIEKGKFEKLIIFTNPVASKNSARLGYYPGSREEKLLGAQTGTMLASKFGDILEVERQIANGKLVIIPFSDLRGFDSTGQKAIIWFLESQNLDRELMELGLSRIGNDCKGIIDGDYSGQVDMDAYAGYNNGMRRVSKVFRGLPFYGEVELRNVHRSKIAEYATLL